MIDAITAAAQDIIKMRDAQKLIAEVVEEESITSQAAFDLGKASMLIYKSLESRFEQADKATGAETALLLNFLKEM